MALPEDELQQLVNTLLPLVKTELKADAQGVSVLVARMHRTEPLGESAKVLAFVDLTFSLGATALFTITGFKLMTKTGWDGGAAFWLATPQRKDKPNADGSERWVDTFKWQNDVIKDSARRVVRNHFDAAGVPNAEA